MRRITATCLFLLMVSVLHNIYLFNIENGEGEEWGNDDHGNFVSRFLASSIRRVKRRIVYRNESLPTVDVAVFGNRTGRNNTVSLIKLLNKNYYIIKKRYYAILANKSIKPPSLKFSGRELLERKRAEAAAKAAANKTTTPPPAGAEPTTPGAAPAPAPAPGS